MSDFTKTIDYAAKDALLTGDPNKLVVGTELDTEFDNIATAIATKYDSSADVVAAVEAGTDSNTFTDADHSKLDAIEASATADQSDAEIATAVEAATDSNTFTDADHSKLDAIEASATADQTNAEIATAVEAATDSNTFTDADHSKLNAIEASADVTDVTNVLAALVDAALARVKLLDYSEVTNAIGSTGGGTQSIDLELGNSVSATVDTSENTFTFDNPTASDELCGFTLVLTNGGSQVTNWPASVDFAGGVAPTLTAAGVDVLVFITIDGGTTWHGAMSILASA